MAQTVLVVDDEQHIQDVVVYILEEQSYTVYSALNGDDAMVQFEQCHPDLVLLDLNLPGKSGLDLFRLMRNTRSDLPIIMLTSKSEEIDRVVGLEMGADDYVTKPFSPRELAARVGAVLRRFAKGQNREESTRLVHGPIELDTEGWSMTYHDQSVILTRPEFCLIESLVRHPARVYSRDMLITIMYDGQHAVTERSVDAHIKRLRKKLSDIHSDCNPIETVHGLGYKLNAQLKE
jgi:two-component system OmpR family response regulator